MPEYCSPDQEQARLKRFKQASDPDTLAAESMAWEHQLLLEEQAVQETPTLPQILAEEAQLASDIPARQAELAALRQLLVEGQAQLPCIQTDLDQAEAAAGDMWSSWSIFSSPEEQASIDAIQRKKELVEQRLTSILARITALELALDGAQRRQAAMPALTAAATEQLGDTASIAVQTRDQRDWTYEYAENMAEVKPGDPDSELQKRMDKREAAGQFDCDTFVVHVLEEAGYDLDAVIVVEGQETTVRRFVMLHAETILRDEFQIPEGSQKSPLSVDKRQEVLHDLLVSGDARMGGVATALVASGQGRPISSKDELRPGDLLQYWKEKTKGSGKVGGHAVVVHKVRTSKDVLDEGTAPDAEAHSVRGIGVLSAHYKKNDSSDVFTKDFVDPDRAYTEWFAVRPAGSKWPLRGK